MKKTHMTLLAVAVIASAIVTGCAKKATEILPTENTNTVPSVSFTFNDASGVMVAVKTITLVSAGGYTFPSELNIPLAVFPTSLGSSTYQDAGTVTFNSKSLKKESNNSYDYTDIANPVSYDQIHWIVSGSSGVPAIDYSNDRPVPAFTGHATLPTTISKSAGLTVNLGSAVTGADSVYVEVISASNSKTILKRTGGNAASVSFSASDLSTLGSGSGYLEVVPWNLKMEDFSSKNFYFINETAYVVTVTIN
jgi:hypothetical protein